MYKSKSGNFFVYGDLSEFNRSITTGKTTEPSMVLVYDNRNNSLLVFPDIGGASEAFFEHLSTKKIEGILSKPIRELVKGKPSKKQLELVTKILVYANRILSNSPAASIYHPPTTMTVVAKAISNILQKNFVKIITQIMGTPLKGGHAIKVDGELENAQIVRSVYGLMTVTAAGIVTAALAYTYKNLGEDVVKRLYNSGWRMLAIPVLTVAGGRTSKKFNSPEEAVNHYISWAKKTQIPIPVVDTKYKLTNHSLNFEFLYYLNAAVTGKGNTIPLAVVTKADIDPSLANSLVTYLKTEWRGDKYLPGVINAVARGGTSKSYFINNRNPFNAYKVINGLSPHIKRGVNIALLTAGPGDGKTKTTEAIVYGYLNM